MKNLTFLLAAGALLLGVACTRDRISSVQLTSTNMPVVTGSGYAWVESKRGSRVKRGIVISNALPVYTTDELKGITPCLIFTGDDPTVNNLLFHRAIEVNRSPTLPRACLQNAFGPSLGCLPLILRCSSVTDFREYAPSSRLVSATNISKSNAKAILKTRPNIPIFFMSREKIHVQSLSTNLVLKSEGVVRVQNVKLIPK